MNLKNDHTNSILGAFFAYNQKNFSQYNLANIFGNVPDPVNCTLKVKAEKFITSNLFTYLLNRL